MMGGLDAGEQGRLVDGNFTVVHERASRVSYRKDKRMASCLPRAMFAKGVLPNGAASTFHIRA